MKEIVSGISVVVPELHQTGVVNVLENGQIEVILDKTKEVVVLGRDKIRTLRWSNYGLDKNFVVIVKAWEWRYKGLRKIRFQTHPRRSNGALGGRVFINEYTNGVLTRNGK